MSEIEEKKEYLRSYEKAVRQMERSAEKIKEMRLGQIIPAADNDGMPHAYSATGCRATTLKVDTTGSGRYNFSNDIKPRGNRIA